MINLFKTIKYPSGEQRVTTALQSWTVSWFAYNKSLIETGIPSKKYEVFTDEEAAKKFVDALREANLFLKNDARLLQATITPNQ